LSFSIIIVSMPSLKIHAYIFGNKKKNVRCNIVDQLSVWLPACART
jgi:hypothetical protein